MYIGVHPKACCIHTATLFVRFLYPLAVARLYHIQPLKCFFSWDEILLAKAVLVCQGTAPALGRDTVYAVLF